MKVLIVDDHPIVISGCRALLAEDGACEILSAQDAAEAKRLYVEHKPDVAIIDINLPDTTGFELTRQLLAEEPEARILIFSMNDDAMYAAQALECGAKGYVSKNDDPEQFRKAIEIVAVGGTTIPAGMAERVAFLQTSEAESARAADRLSPRDTEILRLLTKGRSMSEIAGLINVSYKTVASLCAAMRVKLNARTQAELVRIAVERKIV